MCRFVQGRSVCQSLVSIWLCLCESKAHSFLLYLGCISQMANNIPIIEDETSTVENIIKAFPYATFLIVLIMVIIKNEHAIAIYDMGAYELGISRMFFAVCILGFILLLLGLWKLLSYYLKKQKERVAKEIVFDKERAGLIRLFEATGK